MLSQDPMEAGKVLVVVSDQPKVRKDWRWENLRTDC